MVKLCEHLLNLKLQKVANFFGKYKLRCTGDKKHDSNRHDICLSCGESRCEEWQAARCSYQHSYGTSHPLVFRIKQQIIFCFICSQNVTHLLVDKQDLQNVKKIEKIIENHDKIVNYSQKIPTQAVEEKVIKENDKKIETIVIQKQKQKLQGQQKQSSKKLKIFGLNNLGNTCFFNSTIQCLYATQSFHEYYQDFDCESLTKNEGWSQINLIFKKILRNNDKNFNPKSLFACICRQKSMYKNMDQQDAQQLLGVILNSLIEGEKKIMGITKAKQKQIKAQKGNLKLTITQLIFGLYLASRLYCQNCQLISWSIDFSLGLSVQLSKLAQQKKVTFPEEVQIPEQQIKHKDLFYPKYQQTHSFIDQFFAPQFFTKNNYFKCQKCNQSKAIRKFYIKDPPYNLIVSLKRFNNNGSKNNSQVKIPFQLDMSGYILNLGDHSYEIYGIVVHSGSSNGGHYVAYTRRGQQWIYFSDSSFKSVSWEKVKSCQPYILFYRKIQS